MPLSFILSEDEKKFLCRQAALAIDTGLTQAPAAAPVPPEAECGENSALFRNLGSFVTITMSGNLRGCIGTIIGREPLWQNVWNMARQAAFNDPRFPPLTEREWSKCAYEISVLDDPAICPDPSEIVIGRDGLILSMYGKTGVFLPQVPVEQHWDLQEYLENLCRKAGLPSKSWQNAAARLYWYQALVFHC